MKIKHDDFYFIFINKHGDDFKCYHTECVFLFIRINFIEENPSTKINDVLHLNFLQSLRTTIFNKQIKLNNCHYLHCGQAMPKKISFPSALLRYKATNVMLLVAHSPNLKLVLVILHR